PRMRLIVVAMLALLGTGARADVVWRDAALLTIEGRGWADTEGRYDRLPARAKGKVPESVWGLSKDSAGLAVRFQTDASEVHVRWSLNSESLAMPHMPATGVSGVDLYELGDKRWVFVANGRPGKREGNATRFGLSGHGTHDLRLYLPLYNGISKLEIGVPEGSDLRAGPVGDPRDRIVYYGTSIAQGGCASRPGTAHVAILGRMLGREMVNLGFSGSGRMEPEVASLIAELPCAMFVVDCLWNMDEDRIVTRVIELAAAIRKAHPEAPIVFVGQSHINPSAHPTGPTRLQEQAVAELRRKGFSGLHLVPGARLVGGDGEGTVDGVHPNDLGMMRQAEALEPALKRALRSP
ncbi:MAG: lysophospholipase, partial [Armatimonadetes bacterium]|nr:lysophospholipase [Armatimonadota bacterium]